MDEQWVPIDIHYNKLLDWLIDRRHCDLRWHHQLREIKSKIKSALVHLPKDEPKIISATDEEELSYFDCYDIMKYLLTVESHDKNFLGQYSSPKLKEWNDILRSYERNNVHLAEGAHIMSHLVNYEIASLKKQINRCQQQQREYSRKASDSQASAHSLQIRFEEQCHELEIEGKNVHQELTQQIQIQLPNIFDDVVSIISSLQSTINYYEAFRASTVQSLKNDLNVLAALKYLMKNGNTTVYEWKNGKSPNVTQQKEQTELGSSHHINEESVIDWGDFEAADIVFDYNMDQVDISEITVEEGGESVTMSLFSTYPTLLEDIGTRNLILDDLMELLEFTKQRVNECQYESGGVLQVDLPSSVQGYSSEDVQDMVDKINTVIGKLTNKKTKQLLLMLGSQSYLERISSQLLRQQEMSQKAALLAIDHTYKIKESGQLQQQYESELEILVKEIKRIKELVAKEISKKYNNRTVNIVGEI